MLYHVVYARVDAEGKHRVGTLWTRGLRGSALMAYIHGGIP